MFLFAEDADDDPELNKAIFTRTTRGKEQLIYCGQPFIYEKNLIVNGGVQKKFWRCNQWWNERCRARVYTLGDIVTPLNKYHTHDEVIKRKKRVSKKDSAQIKQNFVYMIRTCGDDAETT